MGNKRNVAKLRDVLESLPIRIPTTGGDDRLQEVEIGVLAQALAEAGVLAPAALTDDEAVKLGTDAMGSIPQDPAEIALCVREGLAKIARGES